MQIIDHIIEKKKRKEDGGRETHGEFFGGEGGAEGVRGKEGRVCGKVVNWCLFFGGGWRLNHRWVDVYVFLFC